MKLVLDSAYQFWVLKPPLKPVFGTKLPFVIWLSVVNSQGYFGIKTFWYIKDIKCRVLIVWRKNNIVFFKVVNQCLDIREEWRTEKNIKLLQLI